MLVSVEKIGLYVPIVPSVPKINGEYSSYYYSQR